MSRICVISIICQLLTGFVLAGTLDGGDTFRIWIFSEAVYLPVVAYVLIRRWQRLTGTDRVFLSVGIIPLFVVASTMVSIWDRFR